jgi:hypothetical protein
MIEVDLTIFRCAVIVTLARRAFVRKSMHEAHIAYAAAVQCCAQKWVIIARRAVAPAILELLCPHH